MAYAVRLQQVHNSVVLHPRFSSNASRCIPPANPNSDSSAKTADTVRLHLIFKSFTPAGIKRGFEPQLQHPRGLYQNYL